MISHPITLTYRHQVLFTQGIFSLRNNTLLEILTEGRRPEQAPPRVLLVLDEGLAAQQTDLLGLAAAWFAQRAAQVELRGQPIILPGGETCKNDFPLVAMIWQEIEKAALDRHSYVVVVGGGALLDLVGFAAATAHRGIRLVRVPTTSLSQGDGGVGVKNGINFLGKKNWIGTFAVPHAVINDTDFLNSLPEAEKRAGYVEAVKVALIRDAAFFCEIEQNVDLLAKFDPEAMRRVIEQSAALHVRHIATGGDPFELGSARPLDFGHWVAHKLEQLTEFKVSHGAAVAIGIAVDLIYAEKVGLLAKGTADRILKLLTDLGFTLWHPLLLAVYENDDRLAILRGLEEFREHLGGDLCITLVTDIGVACEVGEMDSAQVLEAVLDLEKRGQQPA